MWSTISKDISELVHNLFASGKFPLSINTTWVSLIPKTKNPNSLNEYRPISVVGCLYKIISRIIINKIKSVISEMINEHKQDSNKRGILLMVYWRQMKQKCG